MPSCCPIWSATSRALGKRRVPIMIERRTILQLSAAAALVASIGASPVAFAQAKERLALKGYDPVAYFTDAKPIPGVEAFEYVWDGQRYRFATASHLNLFKANPDKYAP